MLKIIMLALILVFALSDTADAGYLWKGDTVLLAYPCRDPEGLTAMTEAGVRSTAEGNVAYQTLVESGRCIILPAAVEVVLGERLGQWTLANGMEVEVWEVYREGELFWGGYTRDFGDHDVPYQPEDLSSSAAVDALYLWKGDEVAVVSLCYDLMVIKFVVEKYVESTAGGNIAWYYALGTDRCVQGSPNLFTLGDRLGSWTLANGRTMEIWEVVSESCALYTILDPDFSGSHDAPYVPSDDGPEGLGLELEPTVIGQEV